MNKITISAGHPAAGRVYAEAYGEALPREDALRNDVLCLEKGGQLIVQDLHDYRERLTVAEQRAGELEGLLLDCVNEFSTSEASQFELEMLNRILAALKPAEGEGS